MSTNRPTWQELDKFTRAYIECALWSSTDNADDSGGEPLDRNYSWGDLDNETLAQMISDCRQFQADNRADLDACDLSLGRQGHDFWLNRNGHGAGFWDEGYRKDEAANVALKRLDGASDSWGTFDLYVYETTDGESLIGS